MNLTDADRAWQALTGRDDTWGGCARREEVLRTADAIAAAVQATTERVEAALMALDQMALEMGAVGEMGWWPTRLRVEVRAALAGSTDTTPDVFQGLHACEGCGLELDADDQNTRCDECPDKAVES